MRRRLFSILLAVGLGFGVFDFFGFCLSAANLKADASVRADAAIALTGGSGERIAAGVALVTNGAVPRLLISGVHEDVTMEDVAALAGGPEETYACCVELGWQAATTVGNAQEAAGWASENGYGSLVLVTSDYHLPRSAILMAQAMPEVDLIVYPVRGSIDPSQPLASFRTARSLIQEWLKWRVTKLRSGRDGVVSLR